MEKKELGGLLKGKLLDTAGAVKNTIKEANIPEQIKNVKLPDVKMPEQIQKVFGKSDSVAGTEGVSKEINTETSGEPSEVKTDPKTEKRDAEFSKSEIQTIKAVSPINAVKAFYYMMAADGNVTKAEEERFELVGREIDPEFDEHKEHVIKVCKEQLGKVIDRDDYYDVIQDGVEEALLSTQVYDKGYVPAKMLVWDLLTIAYSDEEYNEDERRLIKYIVRKVDIPKDVFLEMENTYLTVQDIEKELNWIKTTDRSYLTIETQVKELEKRERDILESVRSLIYL